jgi:hypothetical protein
MSKIRYKLINALSKPYEISIRFSKPEPPKIGYTPIEYGTFEISLTWFNAVSDPSLQWALPAGRRAVRTVIQTPSSSCPATGSSLFCCVFLFPLCFVLLQEACISSGLDVSAAVCKSSLLLSFCLKSCHKPSRVFFVKLPCSSGWNHLIF